MDNGMKDGNERQGKAMGKVCTLKKVVLFVCMFNKP